MGPTERFPDQAKRETSFLGNPNPQALNARRGDEAAKQKAQRLAGDVPMEAQHDPLLDSVCLTDAYAVPAVNEMDLYEDFVAIFAYGFEVTYVWKKLKSTKRSSACITHLPYIYICRESYDL